jgi:hypothetical protein
MRFDGTVFKRVAPNAMPGMEPMHRGPIFFMSKECLSCRVIYVAITVPAKEHNGTAILMSMIRVSKGIAISAAPKPETPWTHPATNSIKQIRIMTDTGE